MSHALWIPLLACVGVALSCAALASWLSARDARAVREELRGRMEGQWTGLFLVLVPGGQAGAVRSESLAAARSQGTSPGAVLESWARAGARFLWHVPGPGVSLGHRVEDALHATAARLTAREIRVPWGSAAGDVLAIAYVGRSPAPQTGSLREVIGYLDDCLAVAVVTVPVRPRRVPRGATVAYAAALGAVAAGAALVLVHEGLPGAADDPGSALDAPLVVLPEQPEPAAERDGGIGD